MINVFAAAQHRNDSTVVRAGMKVPQIQCIGAHLPSCGGVQLVRAVFELYDENRMSVQQDNIRPAATPRQLEFENQEPIFERGCAKGVFENSYLFLPYTNLVRTLTFKASLREGLHEASNEIAVACCQKLGHKTCKTVTHGLAPASHYRVWSVFQLPALQVCGPRWRGPSPTFSYTARSRRTRHGRRCVRPPPLSRPPTQDAAAARISSGRKPAKIVMSYAGKNK